MTNLITEVFAMFGVIALVTVLISRGTTLKTREAKMEFLFTVLPAWAAINFGLGAVWIFAQAVM